MCIKKRVWMGAFLLAIFCLPVVGFSQIKEMIQKPLRKKIELPIQDKKIAEMMARRDIPLPELTDDCRAERLTRHLHDMLSITVRMQDFCDACDAFSGYLIPTDLKIDSAKSAIPLKKMDVGESADCELTVRWGDLVSEAHRMSNLNKKALFHAKSILQELQKDGFDTKFPEVKQAFQESWNDEFRRSQKVNLLVEYGVRSDFIEEIVTGLDKGKGDWSILIQDVTNPEELLKQYAEKAEAFDEFIREKMIPSTDRDAYEETSSEAAALSSGFVAYNAICSFIVGETLTAIRVVDAIIGIIEFFEDLFEDDKVRDVVRDTPCHVFPAIQYEVLQKMILLMYKGDCRPDDQRCILKILNCVPCETVRRLMADISLAATYAGFSFVDSFSGQEFRRLMRRLYECESFDPMNWDDDASRFFINRLADCATLSSLSIDEIFMLLLKLLYHDDCTDPDQNAIIKLLRCQPYNKFVQLLERIPPSYFKDELDSDHWDQFMLLLAYQQLHPPE